MKSGSNLWTVIGEDIYSQTVGKVLYHDTGELRFL
jgi:hypothetical protein